MSRWRWTWVWLALVMFQASDIAIRLLAPQTFFAAGAIVQAVPLFCGTLIFLLLRKNSRAKTGFWESLFSQGSRVKLIGYGLCMFFIGNMLYYLAMQTGGLTIAAPCVQSQSVWAVLLGFLILREKITPAMWGGALLFAAGIGGLAYFKSYGEDLSQNWVLAVFLALLAGLSWGGGAALNRNLACSGKTVVQILCAGSLVGIIALFLCGMLFFGPAFREAFLRASSYKNLVTGIFNGTAMLCVGNAIRKLPVSKVIPCLSINIILSTVIGGAFFGEYVSAGGIISILAAFAGVLFVQEPFKRKS